VHVYDHEGNPKPNIKVVLHVAAWEEDEYYSEVDYGYTNSNGFVFLQCCIVGAYNPVLDYMRAYVSNPPYTTIQATGDETTSGSVLFPEFWVVSDEDGNGIEDSWELPLAEKFCPYLILHAADQGVRPVPVEIMDRNGDGNLGWEDVLVRVYLGGYAQGEVTLDRILYYPVGNFTIEGWYSHRLLHQEAISARVDFDGDGFDDEGTNIYIIYPHYEWGNTIETIPTDWYNTWFDKIGIINTSPYLNGTTYAHFFKYGSEVVIQYYFFYPFNASHNRHEGDWEHINVVLNSQNPSTATIQRVEYYFHHKYMNCYTEGVDYYVVGGTHPKVYVAGHICTEYCGEGSHGSYPKAKSWRDIKGDVDEDVHGDGLHIDFDGYKNIIIIPEPDKVDDSSDLNWLIFKGLWGHILSHPSSFELSYSIGEFLLDELHFGDILQIDYPEDVGNVAPVGPSYQQPWDDIGSNSGQDVYP